MATLNFNYEFGIYEEGNDPTVGRATLTYAVSNTSDSTTTVSVSSLKITNVTNFSTAFPYEITVGGTTIASGSLTIAKKASSTKTLSGSKAVMRNVTATTTQLRVTGDNEEDFFYCNKSVAITIPMSGHIYTINYNANGGTGAPPAQSKAHDVALTLSSTRPTRSGYTFRRWNKSSNDTGTYYSPGGSYTDNAGTTLYAIWNPIISFNANGGTGAPSAQTKTYGLALTLSSTIPTRSGYAFKGWATSSTATTAQYQPNGSYNPDNLSRTLYAVWWKEPNLPTISAFSVVRVDANGNEDDEGTYGKVTVTWSVDLTSQTEGNANRGTLRGSYFASSDTSQERSLSWSGTWQNATGGTATATFQASLDEQYLVLVTLTDNRQSASKADILTRAEFVMDFKKGGKAIGIFSAAPDDGLLIGRDTRIDGQISVNGIERTFVNIPQESIVTSKDFFRAYKNNVVCTVVGSGIKLNSWTYSGSKKIGMLPEGYRPPVYMTTAAHMQNANASTAGRYFVEVYQSGEIYLHAQADSASLSTYAAADFTITWAM